MADMKPAKETSTMAFVVVALLLTLVGVGTGLAVGSIMQATATQDSKPVSAAAAEAVKNKTEPLAKGAPEAAHGSDTATQADTQTEVSESEPEVLDPHDLRTVAFPPVLTTLAEPKGKWIRLEGSILITADTEDLPEILAERSGEQILTYLRSLRLDQLEGPTSVLGVREDLTEMLRVLSKGQVKGLLIHGLVVE
jgi:flagellar FliL protein